MSRACHNSVSRCHGPVTTVRQDVTDLLTQCIDMSRTHHQSVLRCHGPVTKVCHASQSHGPVTAVCHSVLCHEPVTTACYALLCHGPVTTACYAPLCHGPVTTVCHAWLNHVSYSSQQRTNYDFNNVLIDSPINIKMLRKARSLLRYWHSNWTKF